MKVCVIHLMLLFALVVMSVGAEAPMLPCRRSIVGMHAVILCGCCVLHLMRVEAVPWKVFPTKVCCEQAKQLFWRPCQKAHQAQLMLPTMPRLHHQAQQQRQAAKLQASLQLASRASSL